MREEPSMNRRIVAAMLSLCLALPPVSAASAASWGETVGVYEAENGVLHGNTHVEKKGSVAGFQQDGDECDVIISVGEAGFYDLEFMIKAQGGYKENYVSVDGQRLGTISAEGTKFQRDAIRRVYLEAGEHTVTVSKFWGYINWDKVTVRTAEPFDESIFQVSAKLVNENATDNAKRLFSYLCDQYGKTILSGQYCDTGLNGWENLKLYENNGGKFPAIRGLDYMHDDFKGVNQRALKWWQEGGLVTICWHTGADFSGSGRTAWRQPSRSGKRCSPPGPRNIRPFSPAWTRWGRPSKSSKTRA